MGSVKDLIVLESPTKEKAGRGRFVFSDRYSVFDWGEMPDHIDNKGLALCIAAAYFFEKLQEKNIATHYLGLIEEDKVKKLSEIKKPLPILETKLFRVLHPNLSSNNKYEYDFYKQLKGNYLIPLEIIYRNSLTKESSAYKRLQNGSLHPADFGLTTIPENDIDLKQAYLDVSTKLEPTDRYITWEDAREIAGLSVEKADEIKKLALTINQIITQEVEKLGLKNEDGKFEFALDDKQNIVLVDVLGTLDECRFTFKGIPISKEIARLYYRKSHWYKDLSAAKEKDFQNWKKLVTIQPESLPVPLKNLISNIYCAFANEITGREWFKGIPELKELLQAIPEFI